MSMRRGIFFTAIALCVGGFLFCVSAAMSASNDIVINEIGAYEASGHEWIEIWNKGSEAVDLTGWKFWENSTNHGISASTTDSFVGSGEYAAICQDEAVFLSDYPGFGGSVFDSSWGSLNESGEEIGLKDSGGNIVELFTYIASPDFSLERVDPNAAVYDASNWREHAASNTLGFVNSNYLASSSLPTSTPVTTPTSTPTTTPHVDWSLLKINEMMSDPDSGNEWVELFNLSADSVDFAGGMICDSRDTTSTCKTLGGTIDAGGWLQFDLLTASFLNNDGDSVILKNPDGAAVDRVDYSGAYNTDKGQSLARKIDGADTDDIDDWAITTVPTPGEANIIAAPVQPQSGGGSSPLSAEETNTVSSSTTSTSTKTTKTSAKPAEKPIGLKWKIDYDPLVRQNTTTIFDAAKTLDPRGGKISFTWNIGDARISGNKIKYTFATSGPQTIIVDAASSAGTTDKKKIQIMVYPAASVWGSGIIISEINSNSSGEDDEEYIAIKNISTGTVNISNWKLAYKDSVYNIPTSTRILAGDTLTFYKTITGFTLNNTAGEILLLNQDDILIDDVNYGKSAAGETYSFNGEEWQRVSKNGLLPQVLGVQITNSETKPAAKSSAKNPAVYAILALARARAEDANTAVITRGVIDVLPGVFGSQYFYIADAGSGMQIYQYKKDFPDLAVGDYVEVKGITSVASGQKRIKIASAGDIDILATDSALEPAPASLSELDEDMLGALVKISGEITEIKTNYMYLDDGAGEIKVYFKKNAKIDKSKFKEGENAEVVGILEQGTNELQILPRGQEDIKILGPSEDLIKKEKIVAGSASKATAEKYLIAFAGGLSALLLGFLGRAKGMFMIKTVKNIIAAIIRRG